MKENRNLEAKEVNAVLEISNAVASGLYLGDVLRLIVTVTAKVDRLQGLRGMYGIASPAPICSDDSQPAAGDGQVVCQVVQAPDSAAARLVPDTPGVPLPGGPVKDGEIRLTYRELTALIENAVKALGSRL